MSHSILENGRVLSAPSLHRESTDSLIIMLLFNPRISCYIRVYGKHMRYNYIITQLVNYGDENLQVE